MPEYIDKEKLYQYLDNEVEWRTNQDRLFALEVVSDFPVADVAPVVHGKWILDAKNHCHCSRCLHGRNIETQIGWNYCPNCGAKMDLEESR